MKKTAKKLVLAKETVQDLSLQGLSGATYGSYSDQMRLYNSWWLCGASYDTFC